MKALIFFVVIAVVKGIPPSANSPTNEPETPIIQEISEDALPSLAQLESDNTIDYIQVKDINPGVEVRRGPKEPDEAELSSAEIEELNDDILAAIKLAAALRFDVLRNFALSDDEANVANEIASLNEKASGFGKSTKNDPNFEINDSGHVKVVNGVL